MPNNLTDAEIKKALEESISFDEPYESDFTLIRIEYIKNALDLINRLEAENKKFKDRQKPTGASGYKIEDGKVVFFTNMLGGYRYEYKDLEEVVKTLNELLHEAYSKNEVVFALKCKTEELKTAKAEAYKEFAERLKNSKPLKYKGTLYFETFTNTEIDNLLNELVGESGVEK